MAFIAFWNHTLHIYSQFVNIYISCHAYELIFISFVFLGFFFVFVKYRLMSVEQTQNRFIKEKTLSVKKNIVLKCICFFKQVIFLL